MRTAAGLCTRSAGSGSRRDAAEVMGVLLPVVACLFGVVLLLSPAPVSARLYVLRCRGPSEEVSLWFSAAHVVPLGWVSSGSCRDPGLGIPRRSALGTGSSGDPCVLSLPEGSGRLTSEECTSHKFKEIPRQLVLSHKETIPNLDKTGFLRVLAKCETGTKENLPLLIGYEWRTIGFDEDPLLGAAIMFLGEHPICQLMFGNVKHSIGHMCLRLSYQPEAGTGVDKTPDYAFRLSDATAAMACFLALIHPIH
ncbi:hypothetical protein NDU88_002416 [Pleurodeles waltl]|uniref:Uncharacterized protein n=1 Tax=Pleurodeles waltl TaxID=8319 RepID=A0AAV7TKP2_PLEWA|nr:hypothetical protein NDU88_002416 [Pleurodeles waltl]